MEGMGHGLASQVKSNSGIVLTVVLLTPVAFFIGLIVARVFPHGDSKPLSDLLIAAVGAFAGTAAGALIALSGDRNRREEERQDQRVEAANVAIHALGQIYSYLWDYKGQIIKPNESDPMRWYSISRSVLLSPELEPFDVGRLAFLFEGRYKNLPNHLSMNFLSYRTLLDTTRRAHEVNEEIQTIARAQRIVPLTAQWANQLSNAATKETLTRFVDTIIDHNRQLTPSVMEVALTLRNALREMYPGRTIVRFLPLTEPDDSVPLDDT
jgi:hypothetical protein